LRIGTSSRLQHNEHKEAHEADKRLRVIWLCEHCDLCDSSCAAIGAFVFHSQELQV
jgi:hypothetical protein